MDIRNGIAFGGRSYYHKNRTGAGKKTGAGKSAVKSSGTITVRRKISASAYLQRVAQAGTRSQVEAVIRGARADLQFVRTCSTDSAEAEKAERIIKRVISKGQLKIVRLKKEQNLELRKKLAGKSEKKEIREELRRRRVRRKAEEAADTLDTECATVEKRQELYAELREEEALRQEEAAASLEIAGAESLAGLSDCSGAAAGTDCGGAVDLLV